MTGKEKAERYEWLLSQRDFHARKQGKWHKSQARWFARQLATIYTFSEIVVLLVKKHKAQLVENITQNNALLQRLKNRGFAA